MAHQLHFLDLPNGDWLIYLIGRDEPIGWIKRTPNGRWSGWMVLDGRPIQRTLDKVQDIVDTFNDYATNGVPSQDELLAQLRTDSDAWIRRISAE